MKGELENLACLNSVLFDDILLVQEEQAPCIADPCLGELGVIAKNIATYQPGDRAAAIDEPAYNGATILVFEQALGGVVFRHRVDQIGGFIRAGVLVKSEAWTCSIWIETERALFHIPAIIPTCHHHINFLKIVLAYVAYVEVPGLHIESEAEGVAEAVGINLTHSADHAYEGFVGRDTILSIGRVGTQWTIWRS